MLYPDLEFADLARLETTGKEDYNFLSKMRMNLKTSKTLLGGNLNAVFSKLNLSAIFSNHLLSTRTIEKLALVRDLLGKMRGSNLELQDVNSFPSFPVLLRCRLTL